MTHSCYSIEQIAEMESVLASVTRDFEHLFRLAIEASYSEKNTKVQRYLRHGIARRLRLIHRQTECIFTIIPPDNTEILTEEKVLDAQTYMQALVHNIHGLFDTFAWATILRYNNDNDPIDPRKVSISSKLFKRHAPDCVNEYITSEPFRNWHNRITEYRDALAHRIPLYIPRVRITQDDSAMLNALEEAELAALDSGDITSVHELRRKQDSIGKPCFLFSTWSVDCSTQISSYIHPQILADSMTVIEFSNLFFSTWRAVEADKSSSSTR